MFYFPYCAKVGKARRYSTKNTGLYGPLDWTTGMDYWTGLVFLLPVKF